MPITIVEFLANAVNDKPIDGSDCKTFEAAKKELGRLRRIIGKVVKLLHEPVETTTTTTTNTAATAADDVAAQGRTVAAAAAATAGEGKRKRDKAVNLITRQESFQNYHKVAVDKSSEDRALIKSAIKNNALFKGFLDAELDEFIDVFSPESVDSRSTVIRQGDIGNTFYVVQSGALDIFINMGKEDQVVETQVGLPYRRGGAFGELALLFGSPRAATIRASEPTNLWVINRTAFRGLQLQIESNAHALKLEKLRHVKIGDKMLNEVLDESQLESMAMAAQYQIFEAGSTIIKEGETVNMMMLLLLCLP